MSASQGKRLTQTKLSFISVGSKTTGSLKRKLSEVEVVCDKETNKMSSPSKRSHLGSRESEGRGRKLSSSSDPDNMKGYETPYGKKRSDLQGTSSCDENHFGSTKSSGNKEHGSRPREPSSPVDQVQDEKDMPSDILSDESDAEDQGMDRDVNTYKDQETDDEGDDGCMIKDSDIDKSKQNLFEGKPIANLRCAPECFKGKPSPTLSNKHVMYQMPLPVSSRDLPRPYPIMYEETGKHHLHKHNYVYMPCSPTSEIPLQENPGKIDQRWKVIDRALNRKIAGSFELQNAILSYNFHYKRKWNFENLHEFFATCPPDQNTNFFQETLPKMQKLATNLPHLCTQPIPLLKANQDQDQRLFISQHQAACLLANAFFCTFPGRNSKKRGNKLSEINFSSLFNGPYCKRKIEKLKCIINYFERVTKETPSGVLSFTRQTLTDPYWLTSQKDKEFTEVHVSSHGNIEDNGIGMLQADFANKVVGGGVLGRGCVQEEIRFVICPEMILSRLVTETLDDRDVLIMKGCERFSRYRGYSDTFEYDGDYHDMTQWDKLRRRWTEVVAMDALHFRGNVNQFQADHVHRELHKAYVAFTDAEYKENLPAVATGNWGCGAFGGDVHLKALIQMIAASHAGREICYFTFGDKKLCKQIADFNKELRDNGVPTGDVLEKINDYYRMESGSSKKPLFEFVLQKLGLS